MLSRIRGRPAESASGVCWVVVLHRIRAWIIGSGARFPPAPHLPPFLDCAQGCCALVRSRFRCPPASREPCLPTHTASPCCGSALDCPAHSTGGPCEAHFSDVWEVKGAWLRLDCPTFGKRIHSAAGSDRKPFPTRSTRLQARSVDERDVRQRDD